MPSFSADNFSILFKKNWPVSGLANAISKIDRVVLWREYKELKRCPPRRAVQKKQRYFVEGHIGELKAKVKEKNNRFEEHLAVALWNLDGRWSRHDSGWFHMLDYQFPLMGQQSDKGIGKVDLLGVTDKGRLMVIDLHVQPKGGGRRGESPVAALIQGLRYAAIVEANLKVIIAEVENHSGARFNDVKITKESPIIQILAPKCWWYAWFELGARTRNKAGDWELEFCNLIADIEKQLDLTVECMALDDVDRTDIIYGTDCKTPQIKQNPAIDPVRVGNTLSVEKISSI